MTDSEYTRGLLSLGYRDYIASRFLLNNNYILQGTVLASSDLEGTDGLYEIRIQLASDIFRIFCFFDEGKLVVLANGFQKKTQKTPKQEIVKALKIKEEYYESKK